MFPTPIQSSNVYTTTQDRASQHPLNQFSQQVIPPCPTSGISSGPTGFGNFSGIGYTNGAQSTLNANHLAARQVLSRELPIFNGKPEEWPMFISSFETSNVTCGFSNSENLIRLQKSLKGRALEAVRYQLLLPDGVPNVIRTLRTLFGRPEIIINHLLQTIKNQPAINDMNDKLDALITFSVAVQNLHATIESSGLVAHLNNPILLQELTDKLPASIKLSWAIYRQATPFPTLTTFNEWLAGIAQAASNVTLPPCDFSHQAEIRPEKRISRDRGFLHEHVESDSKSSTSNIKKEKTIKCLKCNADSHKIDQCSEFRQLSHKDKWSLVKQFAACRKCLGVHAEQYCKSSLPCGKNGCKFKHHKLLHNDTKSNINVPESSTAAEPSISNCNAHQHTKEGILFHVVPVILYGHGNFVRTYAFLDEGSSITLIEDDLANKLKLNGSPQSLCLKWTSDTVRVESDSKRVSVDISGTNTNAIK